MRNSSAIRAKSAFELNEADKYASPVFAGELAGAPAMVMALGIFLLSSCPFLLNLFLSTGVSHQALWFGASLLGIFTGYLVYLFVKQINVDRRIIWDYTSAYFRIGTWVAGMNVFARVINIVLPIVGRLAVVAGWILWLMYMFWLLRMAMRRDKFGQQINGTAFLTTVATQSVVLSILEFWPNPADIAIYLLLCLNILGLVYYCIFFSLIWIVRGVKEQLANWVPANNITHGALSISILAGEMIEANSSDPLPYFHTIIQVTWMIAASFFIVTLFTEIVLFTTGKKPLLAFQMSNYARNFTYGMFFACTYYGVTHFPDSIMQMVMSQPLLLALAVVVAVMNVWELSRHILRGYAVLVAVQQRIN